MRQGQVGACRCISSVGPVEQDAERLVSRSGGQNPDTSDMKAWIRAAQCRLMSSNGDCWQDNTAHQAGITSNCWIQWTPLSPDLSPAEPLGRSSVDAHTANRAAAGAVLLLVVPN